jgi:hypothetical protein
VSSRSREGTGKTSSRRMPPGMSQSYDGGRTRAQGSRQTHNTTSASTSSSAAAEHIIAKLEKKVAELNVSDFTDYFLGMVSSKQFVDSGLRVEG